MLLCRLWIKEIQHSFYVQVPVYSFKESKRIGYKDQDVPKSRIIIIEGIYALSDRIRYAT